MHARNSLLCFALLPNSPVRSSNFFACCLRTLGVSVVPLDKAKLTNVRMGSGLAAIRRPIRLSRVRAHQNKLFGKKAKGVGPSNLSALRMPDSARLCRPGRTSSNSNHNNFIYSYAILHKFNLTSVLSSIFPWLCSVGRESSPRVRRNKRVDPQESVSKHCPAGLICWEFGTAGEQSKMSKESAIPLHCTPLHCCAPGATLSTYNVFSSIGVFGGLQICLPFAFDEEAMVKDPFRLFGVRVA